MLKFEGVDFFYGDKAVLKNFDFAAEENLATCVLGPSGFGKTTLLSLASGLLKPGAGRVTPFSGGRRSFVFQEDRLLPWLTARENLCAVGIDGAKAEEFLRKVGLGEAGEKHPDELSGGMKRRLSIARALAFGGDVFFLDETLQGLDIKTSGEILSLIKSEIAGKSALIITHSPAEAFALADRIVLVGGSPLKVLSDFPRESVKTEEELKNKLQELM